MTHLSKRIALIEEPQTIGMSRKSRELKDKGVDVISLSLGEPDFAVPDLIKKAAIEAIENDYSHYPPVAGYAELKAAICKKFERDNGLNYQPSEVMAATGAKQCLVNAILALVDPGDEVIIPAPYWVSYFEQVKFAGGKPIVISTTHEQDFKISPAQLEDVITHDTKLLIYSSPSNPSGARYSADELEALAEVLRKHPQIMIISDEIYELISYRGKHTSMAALAGMRERTVTVNGLSKGFAMTGYRLGYMAGPKDLIAACDKLQGQFTSGPNTIAQMAAIKALETDPNEFAYMVDAFAKRKKLAMQMMGNIPGLNTYDPDGAFYLFPDVTHYLGKSHNGKAMETSTELCEYLLEVGHVATVPGDAFGSPSNIRLSFATDEKTLQAAIERIEKALKNLQ